MKYFVIFLGVILANQNIDCASIDLMKEYEQLFQITKAPGVHKFPQATMKVIDEVYEFVFIHCKDKTIPDVQCSTKMKTKLIDHVDDMKEQLESMRCGGGLCNDDKYKAVLDRIRKAMDVPQPFEYTDLARFDPVALRRLSQDDFVLVTFYERLATGHKKVPRSHCMRDPLYRYLQKFQLINVLLDECEQNHPCIMDIKKKFRSAFLSLYNELKTKICTFEGITPILDDAHNRFSRLPLADPAMTDLIEGYRGEQIVYDEQMLKHIFDRFAESVPMVPKAACHRPRLIVIRHHMETAQEAARTCAVPTNTARNAQHNECALKIIDGIRTLIQRHEHDMLFSDCVDTRFMDLLEMTQWELSLPEPTLVNTVAQFAGAHLSQGKFEYLKNYQLLKGDSELPAGAPRTYFDTCNGPIITDFLKLLESSDRIRLFRQGKKRAPTMKAFLAGFRRQVDTIETRAAKCPASKFDDMMYDFVMELRFANDQVIKGLEGLFEYIETREEERPQA